MGNRLRQRIAAGILVLSMIVVAYLMFFTPSETAISTPTPTTLGTSEQTLVSGTPHP